MRYAIAGLVLALGACAEGPATKAHNAYQACLAAKGIERCQTEKAQFEAAVAFANAKSQRLAAGGLYVPPAIQTYQPDPQPSRSGIICTTSGGVTICN